MLMITNIGLLQKGKETVRLLFSNLGVSLVLGSIIYAVPGAFISYYLTAKILVPMIERRRLKTAAQQKRFARNQLLQELKHEKEVAFSSKIVEKRRVKTAAQQKKFDKIIKLYISLELFWFAIFLIFSSNSPIFSSSLE